MNREPGRQVSRLKNTAWRGHKSLLDPSATGGWRILNQWLELLWKLAGHELSWGFLSRIQGPVNLGGIPGTARILACSSSLPTLPIS